MELIRELIKRALEEDIGREDLTTLYTIPPSLKVKAKIVAKDNLVLCGIEQCKEVFKTLDRGVKFKILKRDGQKVRKFQTLALLEGRASSILKGERVALNILSHLSGIASQTQEFIKRVRRYKVKILDTRKTIPGLRSLQKYAVRVGGALNHRKGLWDGIIIKENHLISLGIKGRGNFDIQKLDTLIRNIKRATRLKVEVEAESLEEFKCICQTSADIILLDNFSPEKVRKAVIFRDKYFPKIKLEASGGIDKTNIKNFARTGVDFISLGVLTHSPQVKDISLEIIP